MRKLISRWLLVFFVLIFFTNVAHTQNWIVGTNSFGADTSAKSIGTAGCNEFQIKTNNKIMLRFIPECKTPGGVKAPVILMQDGAVFDLSNLKSVPLSGHGGLIKDSVDGAYLEANLPSTGAAGMLIRTIQTTKFDVFGLRTQVLPSLGVGRGVYAEGGKYGNYSIANGSTSINSCYGAYGNALGTDGTRYGTYGRAVNSSSKVTNYGVFGIASGGKTNYAGYFSGDLEYTGKLNGVSDRKFKENIKAYTGALDKVKSLQVKSYTFKTEYNFMNLPQGNQIGLIAQDLEKVFPELVSNSIHPADFNPETNEKISDEVSYKGVNYIGLIPVLIQAIKEQQTEIEKLQNIKTENAELKVEVANLSKQMEDIKKSISAMKQSNNTEIKKDEAYLEQNTPNPFSEEAVIKYFVPNNADKVTIAVYDYKNRLVASYPITGKGNLELTISTEPFTSGTYMYELIVDGKKIDSKKMVVTK
nr:tail fiber domain-containing protein [Bacteroidota bacterium]